MAEAGSAEVKTGAADQQVLLQETVSQPLSPGSESVPTSPSYSSVASKSIANIRRLQESVSVSQSWTNALLSPPSLSQVDVENVCTSPPLQEPDNKETLYQPVRYSVSVPSSSGSAFKFSHQLTGIISPSSTLPTASRSSGDAASECSRDPNWQSNKVCVRERNAVMLNNTLMADITFIVGGQDNQRRIPAHKYVLATGSSVFYAMLYGGLSDNKTDEISVPDVEPEAFLSLLRYLYCDEIHLEPENALTTLYAAKKYIIPYLSRECVKYLETNLSARNACLLLSQSRLFEEPQLMQRCWDVIDAQSEIALQSEGFTDIDFSTLQLILSRETLSCKEIDIFEAAKKWAVAEAERKGEEPTPEMMREILGPVMNLIRFPAMGLEEFADTAAQSGMLTLEETKDIFLHFTAKHKPDLQYPTKHRTGLVKQICHRFQSSAYRTNQWRYRGRCDSIQFLVDRRIFIVGFGLYGSSNGSANYSVRIELKLNGRVLASTTRRFFSDGSSNTFHVFFDQPVQIESDKSYTASAILDGAELSYFGQEGLSEVVVKKVTFQFQCSSESTNGTGVQGGQIPEILFYGPTD